MIIIVLLNEKKTDSKRKKTIDFIGGQATNHIECTNKIHRNLIVRKTDRFDHLVMVFFSR